MALSDVAFVQLLTQNQHILHKICRAYCPLEEDRRDLFQEIVLQLWRAYPNFRKEAKESTWIYRIALNVAISGIRKTRLDFSPLTDAIHQIPNEEQRSEERISILYQAIYTLSDIEKALLVLHFEEKSTEEIVELTGLTPNNIRVKMHRIREKLKGRILNLPDNSML